METLAAPIILYDGVCGLCNALLKFVIRRDTAGKFRFAALQSEAGQGLLRQHGLPTTDFDTMVLIVDQRSYTKARAALRVMAELGGVYRVARLGLLVPAAITNWLYERVARNRYRLFGRVEQCLMPTPELRARFLDQARQQAV